MHADRAPVIRRVAAAAAVGFLGVALSGGLGTAESAEEVPVKPSDTDRVIDAVVREARGLGPRLLPAERAGAEAAWYGGSRPGALRKLLVDSYQCADSQASCLPSGTQAAALVHAVGDAEKPMMPGYAVVYRSAALALGSGIEDADASALAAMAVATLRRVPDLRRDPPGNISEAEVLARFLEDVERAAPQVAFARVMVGATEIALIGHAKEVRPRREVIERAEAALAKAAQGARTEDDLRRLAAAEAALWWRVVDTAPAVEDVSQAKLRGVRVALKALDGAPMEIQAEARDTLGELLWELARDAKKNQDHGRVVQLAEVTRDLWGAGLAPSDAAVLGATVVDRVRAEVPQAPRLLVEGLDSQRTLRSVRQSEGPGLDAVQQGLLSDAIRSLRAVCHGQDYRPWRSLNGEAFYSDLLAGGFDRAAADLDPRAQAGLIQHWTSVRPELVKCMAEVVTIPEGEPVPTLEPDEAIVAGAQVLERGAAGGSYLHLSLTNGWLHELSQGAGDDRQAGRDSLAMTLAQSLLSAGAPGAARGLVVQYQRAFGRQPAWSGARPREFPEAVTTWVRYRSSPFLRSLAASAPPERAEVKTREAVPADLVRFAADVLGACLTDHGPGWFCEGDEGLRTVLLPLPAGTYDVKVPDCGESSVAIGHQPLVDLDPCYPSTKW